MGRRKPKPGVCGQCGRAVVRPTPGALQRAIDLDHSGIFWVAGHRYVEHPGGGLGYKLDLVACPDHERQHHADGWDDLEVW